MFLGEVKHFFHMGQHLDDVVDIFIYASKECVLLQSPRKSFHYKILVIELKHETRRQTSSGVQYELVEVTFQIHIPIFQRFQKNNEGRLRDDCFYVLLAASAKSD